MLDQYFLSDKNGNYVVVSLFNNTNIDMEFSIKAQDCIREGVDRDFLKSSEIYLRQNVFKDFGQVRQGYLITFATKIGELLSSILYLKMSDFKVEIKFVMDKEKDTAADYERHLNLQTIEIL